jgi:hypothetical protein
METENAEVTIQLLRRELEECRTQLEESRQVARDQAEQAEARLSEVREAYDERLTTTRERWQADADEKGKRIDELLETDAGKAYAEVEDMKRQVTRAEGQVERALERAKEAEAEKDRALASVAGGEDIHPADPRVAHIWRKASRIATSAGFCTEYDRIAEALGLPEIEFDYDGYVSVRVSGYVSVPVSGTATRREIADGDVDWSLDNDDIVAELSGEMIEWEVDEVNIEADDQ